MNIIYVSKLCSPRAFSQLFNNSKVKPTQAPQRYHQLLAEGLARNPGVRVLAVGAPPISRSLTSRLWFPSERERSDRCDSLVYESVALLNIPIAAQMLLFMGTFTRVLMRAKRDTAIVCDALNVSMSAAALIAGRLRRVSVLGIVTDVPGHTRHQFGPLQRLGEGLNGWIMGNFSHYLLLTEDMNSVVNPHGRPFIVMEGQVDSEAGQAPNLLANKFPKRVCLYAGTLANEYGIGTLVEAFLQANVRNSELLIFGDGDYACELEEIGSRFPQISYGGVLPNSEILELQRRATVLVNPRPTHHDFTRYSFPSKNLEYMVSGTPVLTTNLPGMPKEHYPHVYRFGDETVDGYAEVLKHVLELPLQELHDKGMRARSLVLEKSGNVHQAARLLALLTGHGVSTKGSVPSRQPAEDQSLSDGGLRQSPSRCAGLGRILVILNRLRGARRTGPRRAGKPIWAMAGSEGRSVNAAG